MNKESLYIRLQTQLLYRFFIAKHGQTQVPELQQL